MHHIKRWAHYNLLSERVSRRNALIFKVYEHGFFLLGKWVNLVFLLVFNHDFLYA